jgi:hypothetical protein
MRRIAALLSLSLTLLAGVSWAPPARAAGMAQGAPPAGQFPVLSAHGASGVAGAGGPGASGNAVATSPAPTGSGAAAPTAPSGGAAAAAQPGLAFDLPAGWVSEKPGSSMRLAQASIPGAAGSGQFALFYFGAGGGGSAAANIDRWVGQIDAPIAPPHREDFTTHGLKVSWVEVAGTMKPSTVGMGPTTAQPGSRLLGAVVEGPGGPWYLKVIGPDATITAARGAFFAMLHGLRPR